jgi:hypothetical protein
VPPDEPADLEKKLADIEESTEQRMHFVADLIPEKSEEIHERADRLSERAEEHRRLADDNKEDGSTAADESEGEGQSGPEYSGPPVLIKEDHALKLGHSALLTGRTVGAAVELGPAAGDSPQLADREVL